MMPTTTVIPSVLPYAADLMSFRMNCFGPTRVCCSAAARNSGVTKNRASMPRVLTVSLWKTAPMLFSSAYTNASTSQAPGLA